MQKSENELAKELTSFHNAIDADRAQTLDALYKRQFHDIETDMKDLEETRQIIRKELLWFEFLARLDDQIEGTIEEVLESHSARARPPVRSPLPATLETGTPIIKEVTWPRDQSTLVRASSLKRHNHPASELCDVFFKRNVDRADIVFPYLCLV